MSHERNVGIADAGVCPRSSGLAHGQIPSPEEPRHKNYIPEKLDSRSVEVRFGDPQRDAPRLLELFTQPSTIEHLAGISPSTTVDEIRDLFKGGDVLFIAVTPSGLIIGTVTVERPPFGVNAVNVKRLAVDKEYRRLAKKGSREIGVGRKLVKAANAFIFQGRAEGGLGCVQARASVILNVANDWIPQRLFGQEGYIRGAQTTEKTTNAWDSRLNKFVGRFAQQMTLDRRHYKHNYRGDHLRHFPKPRSDK